jgi:hypothetical protein
MLNYAVVRLQCACPASMFDVRLPRGRRIRRPTYANTSPVPISATAMPCRPKPAANANAAIVSWLWAPETPAPGRVHGRSRHRPCGGRRPRRRPLSSVIVTALAAGLPPSASATNRYGSSPSTQLRTAKPSSVTAPMGRTLIFLAAEDQRCPVVPENFAPHAKHSHVPVDGGVDVAAVEHHVVDAVHNKGHASLLRQPAAHSLARSRSSRQNIASSPGTIHAKACSAWATQSLSETTAIRLNAE